MRRHRQLLKQIGTAALLTAAFLAVALTGGPLHVTLP